MGISPLRKGRWITSGITVSDLVVLPNVGACYVVYSGKRAVYVGSSGNLRARFSGRLTNDGSRGVDLWLSLPNLWLKFKTTKRYGDWRMDELRLIRRLHPQFNIQGLRRTTAANFVRNRVWEEISKPGVGHIAGHRCRGIIQRRQILTYLR